MERDVLGDEYFMLIALTEAKKALKDDEVPVGAIIVCQEQVIAKAYNMTETLNDVTAHAEMLAFTSASNYLGGKYLKDCTLYVTLEPCLMCAGASYWSQIGKIVFGAPDPKRGYKSYESKVLHPKTKIKYGVLAEQSSQLLKIFFKNKIK